MNEKKKLPLWLKVLIVYLCIAGYCLVCFLVGGEDIYLKRVHTSEVSEIDNIGEIVDGDVIQEKFISNASQITYVELKTGTYDRENTGELIVSILDGNIQDRKAHV